MFIREVPLIENVIDRAIAKGPLCPIFAMVMTMEMMKVSDSELPPSMYSFFVFLLSFQVDYRHSVEWTEAELVVDRWRRHKIWV